MTTDHHACEPPKDSDLRVRYPREQVAWAWVLSLTLLTLTSCQQATSSTSNSSSADIDLDLKAIKARYQNAESYSDNAQVVLQYTLNGIPFEEIHPFSCILNRQGMSKLHRFKIELVGNENRTVARVLDIKSQNLDGQVLCRSDSIHESWQSFSRGSIARHFGRGIDDIPWNHALPDAQVDELLLVAEKLFNGTPPSWMTEENLVESTLVEVESVQFVDTAFKTSVGLVACRFDVHENSLVGIRLPKQLLADEIASSSAVKDISFAILFHELTFDSTPAVVTKIDTNEKPVSEFAQLPEAFPSQKIGKPLEGWNLTDQNNRVFQPKTALGAPAIYIYGVKEEFSPADIRLIEELVKTQKNTNFAWISPPGLPLAKNGFQFSRMGYFSDGQGEMLKQMATGIARFCLITDKQGTIQYVVKPKKNWLKELGPTLTRVSRGDQVAKEMHSEYSSYFEKYQNALKSAAVSRDFLKN